MHWAALVLVVAPIWLVLGALPWALWNRRQSLRTPGSFACKVREVGPLLPRTVPRRRRMTKRSCGPRSAGRFPRVAATGWWVGDVLAVQGASGLTRTRLHHVAAADVVRPLPGAAGRGLGDSPRSVLLILTDGRLVEVAVAGGDARLLAGPLAARVPAHRI